MRPSIYYHIHSSTEQTAVVVSLWIWLTAVILGVYAGQCRHWYSLITLSVILRQKLHLLINYNVNRMLWFIQLWTYKYCKDRKYNKNHPLSIASPHIHLCQREETPSPPRGHHTPSPVCKTTIPVPFRNLDSPSPCYWTQGVRFITLSTRWTVFCVVSVDVFVLCRVIQRVSAADTSADFQRRMSAAGKSETSQLARRSASSYSPGNMASQQHPAVWTPERREFYVHCRTVSVRLVNKIRSFGLSAVV